MPSPPTLKVFNCLERHLMPFKATKNQNSRITKSKQRSPSHFGFTACFSSSIDFMVFFRSWLAHAFNTTPNRRRKEPYTYIFANGKFLWQIFLPTAIYAT